MTSRITQVGKQLFTMAQKTKTDITLYTTNTPNGIKPSILLEELNLEYKVSDLSLSTLMSTTNSLRCIPSR